MRNRDGGQIYAVKSIDKSKVQASSDGMDENQLLNEVNILRKLDHLHIIKLYEIFEDTKHVHLVMELLEGGEMYERIRHKGSYTEEDAMKIMRNILQTIAYLHEKGIAHRDLKPQNIILATADDDYNIKIADFGLA